MNLFATRSRQLGLTIKLTIPFIVILIGALALQGTMSIRSNRSAMIQSLEKRAEILLNTLATAAADPLSLGELDNLRQLLDEARKADPDVAYVVLVNPKGEAVASTEKALAGQVVMQSEFERSMAQVKSLTRSPVPGAPNLFEVATPVKLKGLGQIGVIRLGVSTDKVEATATTTAWTIASVGALALLLGIAIYVYATRRVARPLRAAVERLDELATGDADLTARLPVTSRDEAGQLSSSLNTFLDKLHEIVAQIVSAASRVATAAEELDAGSKQIAAGAREQTEKSSQVATAMQEMSAAVIEVSRNTDEVANVSKQAAIVAGKGQAVVGETVEGMRAIAERVKESAGVIGELGQRSNQIGEIVEVIDDIADQTNLLALNAAIEAARAGEQGRGFAVVADEVRRLAERTAKATKEIGEMIHRIQERTSVVVAQMNERTQEVEAGLERANRAGDSLGEIVQVVQQVVAKAEQIASATQQQSSATEEVSAHVESVATIARQTSVGVTGTAQATEELARLAQEMQRTLGRFKLDADNMRRPKKELDDSIVDRSGDIDHGPSWKRRLRDRRDE